MSKTETALLRESPWCLPTELDVKAEEAEARALYLGLKLSLARSLTASDDDEDDVNQGGANLSHQSSIAICNDIWSNVKADAKQMRT